MEKSQREILLEQALITLIGYADETADSWDSGDSDAKTGKRLLAMAGHLPGYDASLTEVHKLVSGLRTDHYECDNCDFKTGDERRVKLLSKASNLAERLTANAPVPYGICPMCDCFVYQVNDYSRIIAVAQDMAAFVRNLGARKAVQGEDLITDELSNDLRRILEHIGEG